jgi:signal transduction histidine kinase/CheY-like chemotaxis protein
VLDDPRLTLTPEIRARAERAGYRAALGVPLLLGDRVVGVLGVADRAGRRFHAEHARLAQVFADQAAVALENARLYEEARARRREAEIIADLARSLNATLDAGIVLDRVVQAARELCESDLARIALREPTDETLVVHRVVGSRLPDGAPRRRLVPGDGLVARVLASGRPARTADPPGRHGDDLRATEDEGTVAALVAPIVIDDRVRGLVAVENRGPRPFTDRDEAALLRLADQAAIALRNARLFAESERQRREAEALAALGRLLTETLEPLAVVRRIVESVATLLGVSMAGLYRLDRPSGDFLLMAGVGPLVDWNRVLRRGTGTPGLAAQERRPIVSPDVMSDPRVRFTPEARARMERSDYQSVLTVPLFLHDAVIGTLTVGDRLGRLFTEDEVRLLQRFADQAAVAMENARLYTEEQAARREAEAASRMKDEFLATVSHELRTPLTSVLGWITLLRRGTLESAAAARALESVERNARLQTQLVEDLLDVSRIVTGNLALEPVPLDAGAVVAAGSETLRATASARQLGLEIVLPQAPTLVRGDAARLQQVVVNLVSNAVKFTPPGGRIEVRLEQRGSEARLTVSDTGQGIAPEFLPHVFERFRQADSSTTRRHGGLGLGLAIVRHLVELHRGTAAAHSDGIGCGSRFTVTLPLLATAADARPGADLRPADPGAEVPPDLAGLVCCVVDDHPDAGELMATVLRTAGAEGFTVASAREALAAIAERPPDVLVVDIELPDEDGYWLLREIRRRGAEDRRRTVVVAVSAYAQAADRRRGLATGFDAYVAKPIDPAAFCRAIVGALTKA